MCLRLEWEFRKYCELNDHLKSVAAIPDEAIGAGAVQTSKRVYKVVIGL